jgi:predicted secreted protein
MKEENAEKLKLKKGESATIKLKGQGTAGYQWNYSIAENKDIVSLCKDYIMPGKLIQKNIGLSADEVFTITAVETGIVAIDFFQKRSWEQKADIISSKKVEVIIE